MKPSRNARAAIPLLNLLLVSAAGFFLAMNTAAQALAFGQRDAEALEAASEALAEFPLFSPSRRPPLSMPEADEGPVPVMEAPRQIAAPLRWTLVGILLGEEGEAVAIVQDPGTGTVDRIRTGEMRDGWTLGEVSDRQAVFSDGRQSITLSLPSAQST